MGMQYASIAMVTDYDWQGSKNKELKVSWIYLSENHKAAGSEKIDLFKRQLGVSARPFK
jgi:hypothetical protein